MDPVLARLRKEYRRGQLRRDDLSKNPIDLFKVWLSDAIAAKNLEPTALCLSTLDREGHPDARMVLLKEVDDQGFVFATSSSSAKGQQIVAHPFAAATFFWPELERQVRVSGSVQPTSRDESKAIFDARPRDARMAALIGIQSQPVDDRETIETLMAEVVALHEGREPELPDTWSAYRIEPERIEFWQGGVSRLHDRFLYTRAGGGWKIERLAP